MRWREKGYYVYQCTVLVLCLQCTHHGPLSHFFLSLFSLSLSFPPLLFSPFLHIVLHSFTLSPQDVGIRNRTYHIYRAHGHFPEHMVWQPLHELRADYLVIDNTWCNTQSRCVGRMHGKDAWEGCVGRMGRCFWNLKCA